MARKAFAVARSEGFLQLELGYGLYPDQRVLEQLTAVWEIWCDLRGQPEITLTMPPDARAA